MDVEPDVERGRESNRRIHARMVVVEGLMRRMGRSAMHGRIGAYVKSVKPIVERWIDDPNTVQMTGIDFMHAYHELNSLYQIADTYEALVSRSPSLVTRIRQLAEDSFHNERGKRAAGKDTQSEIVAGALLEWAALHPVWRDAGPDWTIDRTGRSDLIEVKRIPSETAVKSAVRQGVKQLHEHGLHGLLWLDVSQLITPPRHSWKCFLDIDPAKELMPVLYRRANDIWPLVQKRLGSDIVDMIVFYCCFPVQYGPSTDVLRAEMHRRGQSPATYDELSRFRNELDATGALPPLTFGIAEVFYYRNLHLGPLKDDYASFASRLTEAARRRLDAP